MEQIICSFYMVIYYDYIIGIYNNYKLLIIYIHFTSTDWKCSYIEIYSVHNQPKIALSLIKHKIIYYIPSYVLIFLGILVLKNLFQIKPLILAKLLYLKYTPNVFDVFCNSHIHTCIDNILIQNMNQGYLPLKYRRI